MKRLLIVMIMSPLLALGQIPIKSFSKNIFVFDKSFDSLATSKKYSKFINQYHNFSDMNKDGKLDIVISAYTDKTQSGTLNVFYNQSTDNQYVFNNKHNFFYRGQGINIEVGDINNDRKLDILAPTQNYHGLSENKPVEYYPPPSNSANNDQTPDKLFIQSENGFTEYTQPDTLATLSGKFIDTDGDGTPEWISSNQTFPAYFDKNNTNMLWKYKFKNNSIERNFILENTSQDESRLYLGALDKLEDEKYFYFPFKTYSKTLINNRQIPHNIYVLKYKKGQVKYIVGVDCDTVSNIPFKLLKSNGLDYFYDVNNEDGIRLADLDNDGNLETIVMRYASYLTGDKKWVTGDPPISILQVFDKFGNDITDKFIEKSLQSDPQNYFSTNGFELTDINGDGLKDILTKGNWGWSFDYMNPRERDKKYILLNTGKFFKGYYVNLGNETNLKAFEGWGIPINLNPGNPQSILVIPFSDINGQTNANMLDLDFSQFKFPCETNKPKIALLDNINFCSTSDSLVLKSGADAGMEVKWYSGNTLLSSKVNLTVKNSGTYKIVLNNLGGCTNEKMIKINKVTNPAAPTITREGNTTLISSTPTGNQWYLDGSIIKGEVGQKINATVNGLYSVKYTDSNGCLSENSASLYGLITGTGLSDKKVIISPNPFDQSIKIEFPIDFGPMVSAKIHDVKGVVVWEKESVRDSEIVDLSSLSVGNYVLNLTSQTNGQVSVVKISKQGR